MPRVRVLLPLVSALVARAAADSTALYQHGVRVFQAPPEAAELKVVSESTQAKLSGPKAMLALKMAMRKVDDLDVPAGLEEGKDDKEGIRQKVATCFHAILNATEAAWLIDHEEVAKLERRFNRKAWRDIQTGVQTKRLSSPKFWPEFWMHAKQTFAKAVFHDEKALVKPEWADDSETLNSVDEVLRRPKRMKSAPGAHALVVKVGVCTVDEQGCLLSPGYPSNYSNRDTCLVAVNKNLTGPLRVEAFETETEVDALVVNGVRYSGKMGPDGIWPQEDIVWFSDYVVSGPGFKVCTTPPSPADVHEPLRPPTVLTVVEGNCTVDDKGCALSTNYPSGYPNNDHCLINVSDDASEPLHVEDFDTEELYDVLVVNGLNYQGHVGPEGVVPSGQIRWEADYIAGSVGWKVCPVTLDQQQGETNSTVFSVRTGECFVGPDGCVQSPKYPEHYPNAGICTIDVDPSTVGPLYSEHFSTEMGYDALVVNGMRFSGNRGPDGVVPYESLVWFADSEGASSGWKICSGPKPAVEPSKNVAGTFTLLEGNCSVADACITSPNYPRRYGNDEHCVIAVSAGNELALRVDDFATESQLDVLTVNGQAFSGIMGPDGVVPEGQIEWKSDSSLHPGGWKVCLAAAPEVVPTSTSTSSTSTSTSTTSTSTSTTSTTTTITTTTTTTTTTTPAPSPWEDMEYYMRVSKAMVEALVTLEKKVYLFDNSASRFRKALEASKDFRPSTQSPLNWNARYINGSIVKTLSPWIDFSQALKPAFKNLSAVVHSTLRGQLFNGELDVAEQTEKFQKRVIWFAVEMVRQHLAMLEQTPEVLPSKLEALKVPIRSFRTELNAFLQGIFEDFEAIPTYFKEQVSEPFELIGKGSCRDSQDRLYDTLESEGCDKVFRCATACRSIPTCQGFTVGWPEGDLSCARCELRVDDGFNASMNFWGFTWAGGNATGPVESAAGEPETVFCFARKPYRTSEWSGRMVEALRKEQQKEVHNFEAASRMWIDMVAKLKTSFWKIMSGIEQFTTQAVNAEPGYLNVKSILG